MILEVGWLCLNDDGSLSCGCSFKVGTTWAPVTVLFTLADVTIEFITLCFMFV